MQRAAIFGIMHNLLVHPWWPLCAGCKRPIGKSVNEATEHKGRVRSTTGSLILFSFCLF